jgi:uncharacterized lipoprotein YehR (DUF1307 family)
VRLVALVALLLVLPLAGCAQLDQARDYVVDCILKGVEKACQGDEP